MPNLTTILDFSEKKAKDFLLREDSYSNIDLPEYFTFGDVLNKMDTLLQTQRLSDNYSTIKPENCDGVISFNLSKCEFSTRERGEI